VKTSYPNKMMTGGENKGHLDSCPICGGHIVRNIDRTWACYKCKVKSFDPKEATK
jgi:ribosomal protein L37AE/L43A